MERRLTMVVDTETTGLPPRNVAPSDTVAWNQCRVVQVAWELYDESGKRISSECHLVRLDKDTVMSEGAERVHGISKEHSITYGAPIAFLWKRWTEVLPSVARLVAHNMAFDDAVLQAEMHRACQPDIIDMWNGKAKACTMREGTKPGKKWPKLTELYFECFGRYPSATMHQADADVRACAEIFFFQKNHK